MIGRGVKNRPKEIPTGVKFILAEKRAVEPFVDDLASGLYIYRPKDRQLLPFRRDFAVESRTVLVDVNDNYTQRGFVAGYMFGTNGTSSELAIEFQFRDN
jgi:hypothetical protein